MKNIFFLLFISLLGFGCDSSRPNDVSVTPSFDFSISRGGDQPTDESMKSSFNDGDVLGIIAENNNYSWSSLQGIWGSDAPFSWSDYRKVQFSAYYPFVKGATLDKVPMPFLGNQTGSQSDMEKLDFICGQQTLDYTSAQSGISFTKENALSHQYAMVVFKVHRKFAEDAISLFNVSIEGKHLFNSSYYSFTDKKVYVSPDEENNRLYLNWKDLPPVGNRGYLLMKILVNPLTLDTNLKFSIEYKHEGVSKIVSTQDLSKEFKSGYYYKYDVAINSRGQLEILGSDINGRVTEYLPDLEMPA